MDGAAVDRDDGGRAPARRRVELPGASGSERGNWRLRGDREDRGHSADQAGAATGAAGACAAVTLAGRRPAPAWRQDDAVERRPRRARIARRGRTECRPLRRSDSEFGNWRLREMAEGTEATGAARNARQPGDRRSRSRLRRRIHFCRKVNGPRHPPHVGAATRPARRPMPQTSQPVFPAVLHGPPGSR